MTQTTTAVFPIDLQQGEGEARWFLGALGILKASAAETAGRTAVSEWLAPLGHGFPLHVHRKEDEWFFVLSGELTFWIDGRVVVGTEGSFVYGPRDVPHTFAVTSQEARFLLVAEPAGFEEFVRAVSEPAQTLTLPPASVQPPAPEVLAATAARFGIEILGPPGIPG